MKYMVDIDALKDCLDMLECIEFGGSNYVAVRDVKRFIDKFPKDQLEIPKLMRCGTMELNLKKEDNKATDAGNE